MNIPSSSSSSLPLQFCIIVAGFFFCCCCIFTLVLLLTCILFSVPLIIYFFFVLIHFVFFAICESNHNCSLCTLHVQRHHIWAHKKGIRVTHLVLLLFIRQSTNVNYANVWYTLKSNRLENACIWRHFSVIFCGVCVCVCACVWCVYGSSNVHCEHGTQRALNTKHQTLNRINAMQCTYKMRKRRAPRQHIETLHTESALWQRADIASSQYRMHACVKNVVC